MNFFFFYRCFFGYEMCDPESDLQQHVVVDDAVPQSPRWTPAKL